MGPRALTLLTALLVVLGHSINCAAAARGLLDTSLAAANASDAGTAPDGGAKCARIPGCRACDPLSMTCSACDEGFALKDGLCECAAGYGSYAACPKDGASAACAAFPQSPPKACPVAIGYGRRRAKDCLCQPCPPDTTSPGGEIAHAMCAPPPILGSALARSADTAALMGAAIASTYQPRCVLLRVQRGAPPARAGGFTCSLGAGRLDAPECVPDAEALAENFPSTGCAAPVIPLLSAAELVACREALKYPYQGEAYRCSVAGVNYKTWADDGFVAVECCVKAPKAASAPQASLASEAEEEPVYHGVSQAAIPPQDLSLVPLALQSPAYDPAFSTPLGDLQLRAAAVPFNLGAQIALDQALADLALQPGRFAGLPALDDAQLANLTQAEAGAACAAEYGVGCPAELEAAGADVDRARVERAAADAEIAAQAAAKLAALLAPPLTGAYQRPHAGAVATAAAAAGPTTAGARVLEWQFDSLMHGTNGTGSPVWAPGPETSDAAFHLLLAADRLLDAAHGGGGLDALGFDAARGAVVALGAVPPGRRVSGLDGARVDALDARVKRLRSALSNPTVDNRALDFVARAKRVYTKAERLAKVMGKAESFTKQVQRISSGIVKRAVGILSKVLNTSEANAQKIIKVAKHITEAALKVRKVTKLLSAQLPVLELQVSAGRALVCVLDTARGAADTASVMANIDGLAASQAYMHSLEVAEQVVGYQMQVLDLLERALDEMSVMKPLEELISAVSDTLSAAIDAIVDPILDVLRKEVCIGAWRWKTCLSLQDVLEGVSRLFRFLLGWAEDLVNKMLEPVWGRVEAWLRRLFEMAIPDFGIDWARLPAIPELPFYNLDHLLQQIRYRLLMRYDTKLTPRKDASIPATYAPDDRRPGWGVAVGVWRARVVCLNAATCGSGCKPLPTTAVFGEKCANTPYVGRPPNRRRATWLEPRYAPMLQAYESDRWGAANGWGDAAKVDRRVSALACDGGSSEAQMCREYLRLIGLPALPPACQQIIDTLITQ